MLKLRFMSGIEVKKLVDRYEYHLPLYTISSSSTSNAGLHRHLNSLPIPYNTNDKNKRLEVYVFKSHHQLLIIKSLKCDIQFDLIQILGKKKEEKLVQLST